jgi:hypothetical protein
MNRNRAVPPVDPIAAEARRAKRAERVGENAACILCGFANIAALTLVNRSLLEAHHIVGRENDDELTAPLCRNCHAEVTEGYRDAGVSLKKPPTFLHRLAAILRALGALFLALGQKLAAWAEQLLRCIERLDAHSPGWRDAVEVTP